MFNRSAIFALVATFAFVAPAAADGFVILDLDGFADVLVGLRVGANGNIYARVSPDGGSTCGIFGLDPTGSLLTAYGVGGRLARDTCATDFLMRPDGTMQLLLRDTLQVRDVSGALISTSTTLFPPTGNDRLFPMAILRLANGKVIVAAQSSACVVCDIAAWVFSRLNVDGSIDTTFGTNGAVTVNVTGGSNGNNAPLGSMYELADGKVIVSGEIRRLAYPGTGTIIFGLTSAGALDFSFGTNGQVLLADGPGLSAADSSGRIYVIERGVGIKRILTDGSIDQSYPNPPETITELDTLLVDSSDRLVMIGRSNTGGGISRREPSGALDTTFNGHGLGLLQFSIQRVRVFHRTHLQGRVAADFRDSRVPHQRRERRDLRRPTEPGHRPLHR